MKTIRRCVFETNSSSTHSITIVSEEEFELWKNGKLLHDPWNNELVSIPDENDEDLETYSDWEDNDSETFITKYTTKNGDKIVAFGTYGCDS
jgi:hypothetical protein